jgi:hypothetical protein
MRRAAEDSSACAECEPETADMFEKKKKIEFGDAMLIDDE